MEKLLVNKLFEFYSSTMILNCTKYKIDTIAMVIIRDSRFCQFIYMISETYKIDTIAMIIIRDSPICQFGYKSHITYICYHLLLRYTLAKSLEYLNLIKWKFTGKI